MSLSVELLKIPGDKEKLPVVLLPAFPFNIDFWIPVAKKLSNISFIVNPPGFPASSPRQGEKYYSSATLQEDNPSLVNYAQAVLHLLLAQGVDKFVVAGCSMGGYTALEMLAQAPACIAGLGLFDTNAQADPPAAHAVRLKMAEACRMGRLPEGFLAANISLLSPTNQGQSGLVEFVRQQVKAAPPTALAWAQQAMAERPSRHESLVAARGIQAVIARGIDDEKSSITQCQEMAAALGIEQLNIAGAGHLLPLEQPKKVASLLEKLVQEANRCIR